MCHFVSMPNPPLKLFVELTHSPRRWSWTGVLTVVFFAAVLGAGALLAMSQARLGHPPPSPPLDVH